MAVGCLLFLLCDADMRPMIVMIRIYIDLLRYSFPSFPIPQESPVTGHPTRAAHTHR
jgi:hypothetical protein